MQYLVVGTAATTEAGSHGKHIWKKHLKQDNTYLEQELS